MSETPLWEQASGYRELVKVAFLSSAIQASKGADVSSSLLAGSLCQVPIILIHRLSNHMYP